MNEFEVVSVFRSSRKYLSSLFMFVHFTHLFSKYFVIGVNCDVHYWILKTNYLASRIKIAISARLHLFCFSYHCLLVSVLNLPVSLRATCARLSGFRLSLPHIYLPEMKKIHSVLYIRFS